MYEKPLFLLALYLANAERERELRDAALARRVPSRPRVSVRRAVGRSVVRFGQHLAGEPVFKPVRSPKGSDRLHHPETFR